MAIDFKTPQLSPVHYPDPQNRNSSISMLRLDTLHPEISGNKWFKLKENILHAQAMPCDTLLTFGGAWSNHLIATAAAARYSGMKSIGIVRGFHGQAMLTSTLHHCREQGMHLHFVSREDYARKNDEDYLNSLRTKFGACHIIPEGGNNAAGIIGATEIADYIPPDTNLVTVAIGTGATFCGLRNGLAQNIRLMGFTVMKNGAYLAETMKPGMHPSARNWQLCTGYHFGGFARHDQSLIRFMNDFFTTQHTPLDFVYTAKMMAGLFDLLDKGKISEPGKIVCIHTGGLQGNESIRSELAF